MMEDWGSGMVYSNFLSLEQNAPNRRFKHRDNTLTVLFFSARTWSSVKALTEFCMLINLNMSSVFLVIALKTMVIGLVL